MSSKKALILEVQSMPLVFGWQHAKTIVELATQPSGTWKRVKNRGNKKRSMSQGEAARIVAEAERRIALADAED